MNRILNAVLEGCLHVVVGAVGLVLILGPLVIAAYMIKNDIFPLLSLPIAILIYCFEYGFVKSINDDIE